MEPAAHLLIVDDDERIRGLLQKFLMRAGFLVTGARDAAHARRLLAGLDFDLIVLDVMMPGEDGVTFCRELRRTRAVPVLLLTAKGETADRIAGLEAGADDYLPKPFEPKELLLRINAILRRVPQTEPAVVVPKVLHLGPVRYDIERGEMWQGDVPLRLTATESHLMRIFSARPGEALTRARLVEELGRANGQAQERAVDVQITRLRRKIEADPRQPRYLQTVRDRATCWPPTDGLPNRDDTANRWVRPGGLRFCQSRSERKTARAREAHGPGSCPGAEEGREDTVPGVLNLTCCRRARRGSRGRDPRVPALP